MSVINQLSGARVQRVRRKATIGGVCCFFNPCRYRKRLENYFRFRASAAAAQIPMITVELGFDDLFDVPPDTGVVRIRKGDVLWQKERLLAIGAQRLMADGVQKIIWMDADIVFPDRHWARRIELSLERWPVVQGFADIAMHYSDGKLINKGAIRRYWETGNVSGPSPGSLWAARAELFERAGLYEHCILGGGDSAFEIASHYTAATARRWLSDSSRYPIFQTSAAVAQHYLSYAQRLGQWLNGDVGWVDQAIALLPHGARADRRYGDRHEMLADFDPTVDVGVSSEGAFVWGSPKPELHKRVREYFMNRREDA